MTRAGKTAFGYAAAFGEICRPCPSSRPGPGRTRMALPGNPAR